MYIQEAVKESLASGRWIQRKSWSEPFDGKLGILPTDKGDCCIIGRYNKKTGSVEHQSGRWNPRAEDLAADDWEMAEWSDSQEKE